MGSSVTATPRANGAATVHPADIAAKRRMNWDGKNPPDQVRHRQTVPFYNPIFAA
jgi:hypothetical protein